MSPMYVMVNTSSIGFGKTFKPKYQLFHFVIVIVSMTNRDANLGMRALFYTNINTLIF